MVLRSIFLAIPNELYLEIRDYLENIEYYSFISCAKWFFDIRFCTRRIFLNNEQTSKCLIDKNYWWSILHKVNNPYYQLKVETDSYLLGLQFPNCELIIGDCESQEIDVHNRRYISLSENSSINKFTRIQNVWSMKIRQFSALSNLESLTHLTELILENCSKLADVSCLGKLHKLSIIRCPRITNIKTLGSVHFLCLRYCEGIESISCLTHNYQLEINNVRNIYDWDNCVKSAVILDTDLVGVESIPFLKIPQMKSLRLNYNALKSPTSSLGRLHTVCFYCCAYLKDLNGLSDVQVVKVDGCGYLRDISALKNQNVVWLKECPSLYDFSSLERIPKVSIIECPNFTDGYEVEHVQYLTIENCRNFSTIFMLGKVKHLCLTLLGKLQSLDGVGSIPVLEINDCPWLEPFEGIGKNNQKIILSDCYGVKQYISPNGILSSNYEIVFRSFTKTILIQSVKN
jgi:hypothetical protein